LAHIADQVFLDLSREIEAQGVSRKVVASMFGMALRGYQRKVQRLTESSTHKGKTLCRQSQRDHLRQWSLPHRGQRSDARLRRRLFVAVPRRRLRFARRVHSDAPLDSAARFDRAASPRRGAGRVHSQPSSVFDATGGVAVGRRADDPSDYGSEARSLARDVSETNRHSFMLNRAW
jgi:hypothetical protein